MISIFCQRCKNELGIVDARSFGSEVKITVEACTTCTIQDVGTCSLDCPKVEELQNDINAKEAIISNIKEFLKGEK